MTHLDIAVLPDLQQLLLFRICHSPFPFRHRSFLSSGLKCVILCSSDTSLQFFLTCNPKMLSRLLAFYLFFYTQFVFGFGIVPVWMPLWVDTGCLQLKNGQTCAGLTFDLHKMSRWYTAFNPQRENVHAPFFYGDGASNRSQ